MSDGRRGKRGMRRDLEKKLHEYMVAGGSPAKWTNEAILRAMVADWRDVLATLERWQSLGWYDFGLSMAEGWLTAAGAVADVGAARPTARLAKFAPVIEEEAA